MSFSRFRRQPLDPVAALAAVRRLYDVEETGDPLKAALAVCPVCGDEQNYRHYLYLDPRHPAGQGVRCFRNNCWTPLWKLIDITSVDAAPLRSDFALQNLSEKIEDAWLGLDDAPADRQYRTEEYMAANKWRPLLTSGGDSPYLEYARRRRFPASLLSDCGYFLRGRLAGRLCLLVRAQDKRPIFVMGRAIASHVIPKYLYPEEEEVGCGKSHVVYGADRAPTGSALLICEGIISAASASEFLGQPALAILGSAVSEEQSSIISGLAPSSVTLLIEEGQPREFAQRALGLLARRGIPCFAANLMNGDPNDDPTQLPAVLAKAFDPWNKVQTLSAR